MKRVAFIFAIFYLFILISSVSAEVCLDADKGDLGERGRTAVLDDQGYEKSFNLDYCTDSNNQTVQGIFSETNKYQSCSGPNCYIVEFVCKSDAERDYSVIPCATGCASGACPTGSSYDYLNISIRLNEGEVKYLTMNKKVYSFQLDPFMGDKVGIEIDRRPSALLAVNDTYEFDDLILKVLDIGIGKYYGDTGEGNLVNEENGRVVFIVTKKGCEPVGLRDGSQYCSPQKQWVSQKSPEDLCQNDFECSSNLCVSSKCVNPTLWEKIINWFNNLFGKD
ncbi:MAG: hypothetical protein QT11_C0001G0713 [archaeon GW2011_AR20]|nr:MAG: hypothetical protein QT11_C0001G0713 [archaeon GW2011_AR20]MBS3160982.1 hypothetical protein [Candidatus Woesearchaeota archaeon]